MKGKEVKTEWDRDTKNMGFLSYWYYQYILCSALYMLEPWERNLFRILLLLNRLAEKLQRCLQALIIDLVEC